MHQSPLGSLLKCRFLGLIYHLQDTFKALDAVPWNLPFIVSSDDFDGPRIHVEKKWHTVYESTVPTQTINAQKLVVFSIPYGHFISYIDTSIQFFF